MTEFKRAQRECEVIYKPTVRYIAFCELLKLLSFVVILIGIWFNPLFLGAVTILAFFVSLMLPYRGTVNQFNPINTAFFAFALYEKSKAIRCIELQIKKSVDRRKLEESYVLQVKVIERLLSNPSTEEILSIL